MGNTGKQNRTEFGEQELFLGRFGRLMHQRETQKRSLDLELKTQSESWAAKYIFDK
jgi:hypothetical protein